MYVHICKLETLQEAYKLAKQNNGAPGIDGVTFSDVEAGGLNKFLVEIQAELLNRDYRPIDSRKVKIPKADGKCFRELSIPTIKDRIVAGAIKLILEPIFEADFQEGSFGYRPKRQASKAISRVTSALQRRMNTVIDLDISNLFGNVRHDIALAKIAKRIHVADVMWIIKLLLKSGGKTGLMQGGPLSPLISNIYLNCIDEMLEKAKSTTKSNGYEALDYARFADDLVVLVHEHRLNSWLIPALIKRLGEELAKLGLMMNAQKTKVVDFKDPNQSFHFLGFDFRVYKTRKGKEGIMKTPRRQARIKLQQKIKQVFKTKRGRPIQEVIDVINPILRGWANYFRIGNSTKCFNNVKDWVQNKVRRHLYKAKQKDGFGWKRWSTDQLYQYTHLYSDYRIRYAD